ncbi:MAG: hypothetical protein AB1807_16840 [Pseudomonadota bacterium]
MLFRTKVTLSNSLMTLGLLPYLVVFGYLVGTSGYRGDAALTAWLTAGLGLALSYVMALTIALPAFLWSSSLAKHAGTDTRHARILRLGVIIGVAPFPLILPALALAW